MNETEGMLKLFALSAGEILGAQAYGAHAADIIHFILHPVHRYALNLRHVSAPHA
jgi:pyruvate/2-oxoglutarate dehydrogenase complex dihydrolipoamide dehydrogenase (E3) component